ncbi:Ran-binding protein 9/10 [Entomortierella parvispora]|uniref:Ran-binding protein 9/10 n=1 Tax=Entomortierella parvispora TaxID=205924 RepID=A0A9P3H3X5_9FUNG|nr:Ran-binding protein 9/10 [Entomortierella parvispora]
MYPQPGHYPYGQQPPPPSQQQQFQPYPPPQHLPHHQQPLPTPPASNSTPPPYTPWPGYPPQSQSQQQQQRPVYQPQTHHRLPSQGPPTTRPVSGSGFKPYQPQTTPSFGPPSSFYNGGMSSFPTSQPTPPAVSPSLSSGPTFGGVAVSQAPSSSGSTGSSAPNAPPDALYKAEMTEAQVQKWQTQQTQQNIKVEVVETTSAPQARPGITPPKQSNPGGAYYGASQLQQQQDQQPSSLDIQAQIQLQLQRQSQLQAIHQNGRHQSYMGGASSTPPAAAHSPYIAPAGLQPTPVEYQSSLTDITPVLSHKNESSLTTLDPSISVSAGLHARNTQPYSSPSNGSYPAQPSAIELQSSLTEVDSTVTAALPGRASGPSSGATPRPVSGSGYGQSSSPMQPNNGRYQNFGQPSYPSAIEEQSSLTEIDNLPHPIEAQSSLTELDNLPHPIEAQSSLTELDSLPHPIEAQSSLTELDDLPHPIEAQSSLTELDNLPHPIEAQSALTEVDTLPYGLQEQSALTELDDLPSALEDQSSLTVVDNLPNSLNEQSPLTEVDDIDQSQSDNSIKSSSSPATSHPLESPTATKAGPSIVQSVSPVSSPGQSATGAASSFSMSNWTLPSEFSDPSNWPDADQNNEMDAPSSRGHSRSPAMHIDTSLASVNERLDQTENKGGSILIPLSPTTAESSGANTPLWKTLSPSNSFKKKTQTLGGKTPVPPPKPASISAAKINHPQAGSSGARFTVSEEINLLGGTAATHAPVSSASATPNVLIYEEGEDDAVSLGEDDNDHVDDGVSAFIRELQSSIPISNSESNGSFTADSLTVGSLKRTESNSSRRSQIARAITPEPTADTRRETAPDPLPATEPPVDTAIYELQQLEATQFEWTFTESEQSTYERIFGLWERPAEDCVSADIAGKVFMTLGLMKDDLRKIWELLNPEEKPILTRTQFIAGLHLVNCKAVGYELPHDLPDELMMSAAAVGRVIVPPRPTQGPSLILPGASEFSTPVTSLVHQDPYVRPASPMLPPMVSPPPPTQQPTGSSFIFSYTGMPKDFGSPAAAPIPSYSDSMAAEPTFVYQQQQQFQSSMSSDMFAPQPMDPPPAQISTFMDKSMPVPAPRPYSGSIPSSGNNSAGNSNEVFPREYIPGPHAVQHPGAEAPIRLSFEDDLDIQRSMMPASTTFAPPVPATCVNKDGSNQVESQSTAGAVVPVNVQSDPIVENSALYASPPDAWDHDAAPPELDVEGNSIRYKSHFKNDMTVSASVTANHPINPKSGVFYFEIMIDRFKGGSAISIGIASKDLRKNCQVGWDLNSWGYHSDDGCLYFGNGKQNIKYSFDYDEGTTVGCGVNFLDKSIFFTLNGEQQGVAFKFLKTSIPLYPAIGLSQAGTDINANFGDQTFLFDIVRYKKAVMSKAIHVPPPMVWNNGQRNDKVFSILPDGLSVIASGSDAGCIRGPLVSPRDKDVFYFEITILYMPKTELGTILVGICGRDQNMKETVGWKPNSYGYSGESGDFLSRSSNRSSLNAKSLSGKMKARARGPPFRSGSVVGCGVDFAARELFFTINGECLGQAFYDVDVLDCYPCVSVVDGGGGGVGGPLSMLREQPDDKSGATASSPFNSRDSTHAATIGSSERTGFEFKANFGQYPFMFDLQAFEASGGQA